MSTTPPPMRLAKATVSRLLSASHIARSFETSNESSSACCADARGAATVANESERRMTPVADQNRWIGVIFERLQLSLLFAIDGTHYVMYGTSRRRSDVYSVALMGTQRHRPV